MMDDKRTLTFTISDLKELIVGSLKWPSHDIQTALDRVDSGLEREWERQEWLRKHYGDPTHRRPAKAAE